MSCKKVPEGAVKPKGTGPFSPVLEIECSKLVVISGQTARSPDGEILGDNMSDQTHTVMKNCVRQLETAGCTLEDVFKVNAYITDMARWQDFNAVYTQYMPDPMPVRTTVQAGLVSGFLVEVEMWAAKK